MNIMFNFLVIISFVISCYGWFWDCGFKFSGNPQLAPVNAQWCADEGGSCSGAGQYFFGDALQWASKTFPSGSGTIQCSTLQFGCDPVPLVKKRCYKKNYPRRRQLDNIMDNEKDTSSRLLSLQNINE
eukprot:455795_1